MKRNNLRRPPRLNEIYTSRSRPFFFVTTCTADRKRILGNHAAHDAFVKFCSKSPKLAKASVGRYVIMPDHIHVFVSAEGSRSLTRWVASLKRHLSQCLKEEGVAFPVWQKGFFDHLLRSSESYSEKWHYVRNNPVRAGLVQESEDWPYMGEIDILPWG